MAIWRSPFTIEELNISCKNTMVEYLGIEFTDIGDDHLVARMPVDHRTIQPHGIMHGGASTVLAETIGSFASNYCVDPSKMFCVGLDINTSHIRMATDGYVRGVARPIHLGSRVHVWEVKIFDEKNRLVSFNRLTTKVLRQRKSEKTILKAPKKGES